MKLEITASITTLTVYVLVCAAAFGLMGCATQNVAGHAQHAQTEQSETTRVATPAQSYASRYRNGVQYPGVVLAYAEYQDPADCDGERSCLVRVCEDYAHMLGTQLHETPDSDDAGVTCVLAWSDECSSYDEIDHNARGIGGERLCTVTVY